MSHSLSDKVFLTVVKITGLTAICCLLFIIIFLFSESTPVLFKQNPQNFLTDSNWQPGENQYSLLPMIIGSVFIMAGTMLIAFPAGLLIAIFCQFYSPPWVSSLIQRIMEIMSGIPAVVYGFLGVVLIVPLVASIQGPGTSLVAGILVLTLIVMPGISIIAYNHLTQIDRNLLYSALALGMTRFNIIRYIVLPEIRKGLYTGFSLQSGRAIGETLAVLMVCGNVVQIPGNIFEPVRTLTSNIALEMAYAMDIHRSALFLSGLVLMIVVFLLTFSTTLLQKEKVH